MSHKKKNRKTQEKGARFGCFVRFVLVFDTKVFSTRVFFLVEVWD
jgi:hypothetical protein